MRVLVTGASGFLGRHALAVLSREGHALTATSRTRPETMPSGADFLAADLADPAQVEALFAGEPYHTVVHCGAFVSSGTDRQAWERSMAANVQGSLRLAAMAAESGAQRLVFCSTTNIYGDLDPEVVPSTGATEQAPSRPGNPYAWSKLAVEQALAVMAETTPLQVLCLRLAGIHGPGRKAGAVFHLTRRALAGEPLQVNEPDSRFSFLFVDDAAKALALSLRGNWDAPFGICNVAGGEAFSLKELAERILARSGSSSSLETPRESRSRLQVFDDARFRALTGFAAAPLEGHLDRMLDWVRSEQ